ncbi:hypothetical protein SCUCBS95973_005135 [Sporothrix curviconia]|uniref:Clr5 domain-containing protein n=1 Tax=Sporothrix curviconia TaxID=1260050 RepID=A0ABP0BUC6_9PEZI
MSLVETMKIMKSDYCFDASPRAYRQQFRNWNICKYNRKNKTIIVKKEDEDLKVPEHVHTIRAPRIRSRRSHRVYADHVKTAPPDTPRPVYATTAEELHTGLISPLVYSSPSSTASSAYVDENLAAQTTLLLTQPTPPQTQYPCSHHHPMARGTKVSHSSLEQGEMQAVSRRESPPSYLYPTTAASIPVKPTPAWQPSYRASPYQQPSTMDPYLATHSGVASYGSENPYQDRPYGSTGEQHSQSHVYHGQLGTKHRGWGISDIATGASLTYEPRQYQLPSPPPYQPHLSPAAAKAPDARSTSARSSPISPSSLPDPGYQASLHQSPPEYHGEPLSVGMEHGRASETIFAPVSSASDGVDGVSLPTLTSASSSPTTVTAHSGVYTSYTPFSAGRTRESSQLSITDGAVTQW